MHTLTTAHFTQNTAHCILHTAHSTLHTTNCSEEEQSVALKLRLCVEYNRGDNTRAVEGFATNCFVVKCSVLKWSVVNCQPMQFSAV